MNTIALADIQIRGSPGVTGSSAAPAIYPRAHGEEAARPQPEERLASADPAAEETEKAAAGLNAFLQSSGSHVQLAFHQEAQRFMVKVIDDKTQQVLKTIPPKELLDLSAKIGEMVGMLLDEKG